MNAFGEKHHMPTPWQGAKNRNAPPLQALQVHEVPLTRPLLYVFSIAIAGNADIRPSANVLKARKP
eukprot:4853006-Amphidinium_carterae.1